MTPFAFEIITPEKRVFGGEVEMLIAAADDGLMGVLAHHEPMLVKLKAGPIRVDQGGKRLEFRAGAGLLDITAKGACALVESAARVQSADG